MPKPFKAQPTDAAPALPPGYELVHQWSLRDMAAELVKVRGLHDGHYEVAFNFQVTGGAFGTTAESALPGLFTAIGAILLHRLPEASPNSVDASQINPSVTRPVKKKSDKSKASA